MPDSEQARTPARPLPRLPAALHRLGLGGVFGTRSVLLEYTGRVGDRTRQTVLDVIEQHDESYTVASGFGPRADWYRHVLTAPDVTLKVGRMTIPATAHRIPGHDAEGVMARYAERHPRAARRLCHALIGFDVGGSTDDFRALGRSIPMVRFHPRR